MRQSQNAGILAALKEGAKITPMDALNMFGCFRLSARIEKYKFHKQLRQTDWESVIKYIKQTSKKFKPHNSTVIKTKE